MTNASSDVSSNEVHNVGGQADISGAIKQKNGCGCGTRVKLTANAKQKATRSKIAIQQFSKGYGYVRGIDLSSLVLKR